MSHLSTIMSRVKRRASFPNPEQDSLFEQTIINLMEYIDEWDDCTAEEITEAISLYDKYRQLLNGKGMPSHNDRLNEADIIRRKLMR